MEAIRDIDDSDPYGDDGEYFDGCPFIDELLLLHQKNYTKDVYWNSKIEWKVSLMEFRVEYNLMVDEAIEKILLELDKHPELFSKYGEYIENLGIKVPDEIRKNIPKEDLLNKFNL